MPSKNTLLTSAILALLLTTPVQADTLQDEPQDIPEDSPQDVGSSRVDARADAERASADSPYVITPHRPNYVLPAKISTRRNRESFEDIPTAQIIDDVELKLQFSFKYPLATSFFGTKHSVWVAYTQQSFWQGYNNQESRPFRETNYEPEVFIAFDIDDLTILGVDPKFLNVSLNHQSNGRSDPTSRSWNRVIAELVFEYDNLAVSLRPWWRIPAPNDDDDNPDIHDYLGYGDFNAVYTWDDYSIDVMLRNNLSTNNNRGAIQVGFTFPLWNRFRGYVQYFNGYGESLIDYNFHTQALGVGIILTNWL